MNPLKRKRVRRHLYRELQLVTFCLKNTRGETLRIYLPKLVIKRSKVKLSKSLFSVTVLYCTVLYCCHTHIVKRSDGAPSHLFVTSFKVSSSSYAFRGGTKESTACAATGSTPTGYVFAAHQARRTMFHNCIIVIHLHPIRRACPVRLTSHTTHPNVYAVQSLGSPSTQ